MFYKMLRPAVSVGHGGFVLCVVLLCLHGGATEVFVPSSLPSQSGLEQYFPHEILQITPVKVSSVDGDPLLAFYMVESSLEPKIEVLMDSSFTATFDYSVVCKNLNVSFILKITTSPTSNLNVVGQHSFPVSCEEATKRIMYSTVAVPETRTTKAGDKERPLVDIRYERKHYVTDGHLDVNMQAGIIGYAQVDIRLIPVEGTSDSDVNSVDSDVNNVNSSVTNTTDVPEIKPVHLSYQITIVRKLRPVDKIFRVIMYCVQVFVATGFGAKLDLKIVKENIFKPIAPAIGLSCQYLLMPLIALAVAKTVPIDIAAVSLGIFVAGCCPGGGASNMYSYLLKGDLSLSITMTALSTVLALAMLPLWLYTLGTMFEMDQDLSIPFEMVAVSLSILITPLVFGIFLKQKFPKVAEFVQKALKPVIVVMSFILIIVGVYSNLYIFRLFKPKIVLAACLLPYVGYLCGGTVAALARQPWKRIKTIAIETGMQNTSIAYILLINSFDAPLGDIAAVAPVASAVMTPLPLFSVTIVYLIVQRCKKKRNAQKDDDVTSGDDDVDADEKLNTELKSGDIENGTNDEKEKLTTI